MLMQDEYLAQQSHGSESQSQTETQREENITSKVSFRNKNFQVAPPYDWSGHVCEDQAPQARNHWTSKIHDQSKVSNSHADLSIYQKEPEEPGEEVLHVSRLAGQGYNERYNDFNTGSMISKPNEYDGGSIMSNLNL